LFKRGWRPPWPEGKYSIAKSVSITLGKQNQEAGFRQVENDDGVTELATVGGRECRVLKPARDQKSLHLFRD